MFKFKPEVKNRQEGNPLNVLLERFPEKPWNWYGLSCNPNITLKDILNHPEKPWN